jgi:hypothetical protein
MSVSTALSRVIDEAAAPPARDDASASAADKTSSGNKSLAFLVAMLLVLGSAAALGYTQWWVPREQALERAQVEHANCLQDVKVYKGKKSYKSRLAQCDKFIAD